MIECLYYIFQPVMRVNMILKESYYLSLFCRQKPGKRYQGCWWNWTWAGQRSVWGWTRSPVAWLKLTCRSFCRGRFCPLPSCCPKWRTLRRSSGWAAKHDARLNLIGLKIAAFYVYLFIFEFPGYCMNIKRKSQMEFHKPMDPETRGIIKAFITNFFPFPSRAGKRSMCQDCRGRRACFSWLLLKQRMTFLQISFRSPIAFCKVTMVPSAPGELTADLDHSARTWRHYGHLHTRF